MILFSNMAAAGMIPTFLSDYDPRQARAQIAEGYAFAGGWIPSHGWKLEAVDMPGRALAIGRFPEDPPFREVSRAKLRTETLILFQSAYLAIVQADGSFEIARID